MSQCNLEIWNVCFYKEKNSFCKLKLQGHHEKPNGHLSRSGDAFLQQPWPSLQYSAFWRQSLNQTVLSRVLQHVNVRVVPEPTAERDIENLEAAGPQCWRTGMNHKGAEYTHLRFQRRHSVKATEEMPERPSCPSSSGVKYCGHLQQRLRSDTD